MSSSPTIVLNIQASGVGEAITAINQVQAATKKLGNEGSGGLMGSIAGGEMLAHGLEKAAEFVKDFAKESKAFPNAHPQWIVGRAEVRWENRIAALRAKKGQPATPSSKANPPGRLTPGTTAATSPRKESGAAVAERTLGPLHSYKF